MIELDSTRQPSRINRIGMVCHPGSGIKHLEKFGEFRHLQKQMVDKSHQLFHPHHQKTRQAHKADHLADTGQTLLVQPRTGDKNQQHRQTGRCTRDDGGQGPP